MDNVAQCTVSRLDKCCFLLFTCSILCSSAQISLCWFRCWWNNIIDSTFWRLSIWHTYYVTSTVVLGLNRDSFSNNLLRLFCTSWQVLYSSLDHSGIILNCLFVCTTHHRINNLPAKQPCCSAWTHLLACTLRQFLSFRLCHFLACCKCFA